MRLLLDTHVFLWWDRGGRDLNPAARRVIENPANAVFVSAASVWEVAIKRRLGKLAFQGSVTEAIAANGFQSLPIRPIDAESAGGLDWPHGDPFDRMLVAQAMKHDLVLVTADATISAYPAIAHIAAG